MYNILIVDDEHFARKTLMTFWNWEKHGCRIVGELSSAHDAMDFIKSNNVDIVFSDVYMPEMNGIELAEYINNNYPQISVVIFSSYSDFDYVKGAFAQNVVDYILKYTISEKVMLELLDKITYKRNVSQKSAENKLDNELTYRKSVIDTILNNTPNTLYPALILAISISDFKIYKKNDEKLLYSNIKNIIAQAVSSVKGFVIFEHNNCIFLYLPVHANVSEPKIMQEISNFVREINNSVYSLFNIRLSYGISAISSPERSISACLEEAYNTLCKSPSAGGISDESEIVNSMGISNERKLLTAISEFNLSETYKCLETIFDINKKDTNNHILINEILAIAANFCLEYGIDSTELPIITDGIYTNAICLQWSKKLFEHLINEYKNKQNYTYHDNYIQNVLNYVAQNYSDENLSLEIIAKHIGINKYYLSRIFKNKLGKSLSSFINYYRIQKAKELLQIPETSLKNCHYLVGFKDYTYFCTQFKKYEGFSPTDYKKMFSKQPKKDT